MSNLHAICEKAKVKEDGTVSCVTGCEELGIKRAEACPFDGVPLEDECPCSENTEE